MVKKREILSLRSQKKQSEQALPEPGLGIKSDNTHSVGVKRPVKDDQVQEPSVNADTQSKTSTKSSNTVKSNPVVKASFNSLNEILSDVFTVAIKKDGKPKPIKVSREHETALKRLQRAELTDHKFIDGLIVNIGKLDPTYKQLLGLVVLSIGAQSKVRRALIEFAVLAISRNWVGKYSGSDNIFVEYASPTDITNKDVIAVICRNIKDYFERQLKQRKNSALESADKTKQPEVSFTINSADLKKRSANVLAIGCLWALETGKCSAEKAIAQMQKVLLANNMEPVNEETTVSYAYASSIKEPSSEFNTAIRYFEQKLEISDERRRYAEDETQHKEGALTKKIKKISELEVTIKAKESEIKALESELARLKGESHERKLSEQATRVHLRDDAGKAKSKAYNLITEDVEPAMQLSLKALMREKPKIEVAVHQIELALESIEESLPWFK
ncbi:hypothetical protein [Shewanella sp. 10N.286.52.B9]|uniref:hypothetical protein n=1 Tax=Shewanella sp. 10N.286.52.B9 TaxID=1880837 RepID=UPI000C82490B|nr:hypothetical protein [Shewanella sp. 10N.286.52.B9]PMG50702.1 hypothetical protein BCU91_17280 [Shewanella sp. 10N.286.52.B9]